MTGQWNSSMLHKCCSIYVISEFWKKFRNLVDWRKTKKGRDLCMHEIFILPESLFIGNPKTTSHTEYEFETHVITFTYTSTLGNDSKHLSAIFSIAIHDCCENFYFFKLKCTLKSSSTNKRLYFIQKGCLA